MGCRGGGRGGRSGITKKIRLRLSSRRRLTAAHRRVDLPRGTGCTAGARWARAQPSVRRGQSNGRIQRSPNREGNEVKDETKKKSGSAALGPHRIPRRDRAVAKRIGLCELCAGSVAVPANAMAHAVRAAACNTRGTVADTMLTAPKETVQDSG